MVNKGTGGVKELKRRKIGKHTWRGPCIAKFKIVNGKRVFTWIHPQYRLLKGETKKG